MQAFQIDLGGFVLNMIGQNVVLHTDDEWNGFGGMIVDLDEKTYHVFCMRKPGLRYFVEFGNASNVMEVIK